jgi:UDP-N-acetylmuramate--alanine ligase
MGTYGNDFEALRRTFIEFLHRLPFYGTAVLCADDLHLAGIFDAVGRPLVTYGLAEGSDYRAVALEPTGRAWRFRAERPRGRAALDIKLALPGYHNVLNALAAIAVATEEGLPDAAIVRGLADFAGVGRRFQVTESVHVGSAAVTLVDDYGHHPTEVARVIETARAVWPGHRIVMAYQPHRFSRTRDLYDDFVRVLSGVDVLVLLEVYGAGEEPLPGADGRSLAQGIRQRGLVNPVYAESPEEALAILPGLVRDGDILLVQGAGNVNRISNVLRGTPS